MSAPLHISLLWLSNAHVSGVRLQAVNKIVATERYQEIRLWQGIGTKSTDPRKPIPSTSNSQLLTKRKLEITCQGSIHVYCVPNLAMESSEDVAAALGTSPASSCPRSYSASFSGSRMLAGGARCGGAR